jgi:hypothetical protein
VDEILDEVYYEGGVAWEVLAEGEGILGKGLDGGFGVFDTVEGWVGESMIFLVVKEVFADEGLIAKDI